MSEAFLSQIRLDGGTQMRANLSRATVTTYAEHIRDGADFPPVVVFHDGDSYWLADGFHRFSAYKEVGKKLLPVDVRSGEKIDAVKYALSANATNGRPRSSDDMRRAYQVAVSNELCSADDTKGVQGLLGCSSRWARELTREAREAAKAERDTRISDLAAEGKSQREIAAEVGMTPMGVNKVVNKRNGSESLQPEPKSATEPAIAEIEQREDLQRAKEIRAAKTEARKKERMENLANISKGNEELSVAKQYPVIYCDPPWRYEHAESSNREIENHYPTMELKDICELPVGDLAYKDAILFMWATSPKLAESLEVVKAWGFTYRTCAVWDKQKIGMGYYFRQQHELLLVATRGSIPAPAPADRPASVFSHPRGNHSSKPHELYEIIEAMYPGLDKIELFCRTPQAGWDAWGNQSDAA